MKKTISILTIAATFQVFLIIAIWASDSERTDRNDNHTLLNFDPSGIDNIHIEDDENAVTLYQKKEQWRLATGFPADQDKVSQLLYKLEGLKYRFPVGNSTQALKRFQVAADQYVGRVQLRKGDVSVVDLYFGTGAGARQTHIRSADSEAVYAANIGRYDIPSKPADWQNKRLLQIDENSVTLIEFDGLTLQRGLSTEDEKNPSPVWESGSLPSDQYLDQEAINDSLQKLASLQFSQLLSREHHQDGGPEDTPLLEVTLHYEAGHRGYQLARLKDSQDYVLKVTDRDEYFQLPSYTGKALVDSITREKYLVGPPEMALEIPGEDDKASSE